MDIQVLNSEGKEVGKATLPEAIFGAKPQKTLLHEVVLAYLANQRDGNAHTKTKSEVSGGGHKPWKQKHTGRARAGSTRSPLWRKGGVVFGPKPRSYRQELPRGKQLLALAQALSARQAEGGVRVVDALSIAKPKTSAVAGLLEAVKASGRTIVVLDKVDATLKIAARNIPELSLRLASDLTAYEVLNARSIVIAKGALAPLGKRFDAREN